METCINNSCRKNVLKWQHHSPVCELFLFVNLPCYRYILIAHDVDKNTQVKL